MNKLTSEIVMSKFRNSFRIETSRLKDWDYSSPRWYYVTINTKDHIEYFGAVEKEKMLLNELGKIAEEEWIKTKVLRKNVELDCCVIMPNHIHGIIIINGSEVETHRVRLRQENEETHRVRLKEENGGDAFDASLRLVKNCLSDIVRGFKSSVTRQIQEIGYSNFSWQSRFYDRIIRDDKELLRIRKYILDNPLKWYFERNNHENICDF